MTLIKRSAGASLLLLAAGIASAGELTFEGAGIAHGSVFSTIGLSGGAITDPDFVLPTGLTSIKGVNIGGGPNLIVGFDSTQDPSADPDLQYQGSGTVDPNDWDKGNLRGTSNGASTGTPLGMLAILQENSTGCGDGTCDSPDDEGSRPAGSLILEFDTLLDSIGFDLIDIEGPSEYGNDSGYVAAFYRDGNTVGTVGFSEFITAGSDFFDASVEYGDNSANRISPITAAQLGITAFDKVEFNFGGSIGIDNLVWDTVPPPVGVPEPATLALAGLGFVVLGWRRRRRR